MKDNMLIELPVGCVFSLRGGPVLEVKTSDGRCGDCYFNTDNMCCPDALACIIRNDNDLVVFVERKEE